MFPKGQRIFSATYLSIPSGKEYSWPPTYLSKAADNKFGHLNTYLNQGAENIIWLLPTYPMGQRIFSVTYLPIPSGKEYPLPPKGCLEINNL